MTVPRAFDLSYRVLCVLLFVFVLLRAWLVPFAHDEVATFYFYIQPGSFTPFKAHPDANGHFLTSALGWICFKVFGSSPLSLRLPSVGAFVLHCYAIRRFWDLFDSKQVQVFFSSAFLLLYTFLAYFSLCRGYGISMACLLMAAFYFFSYLRYKKVRQFLKFVVFIQLALAANLTLLFVAGLCSAFCLVTQVNGRSLLRLPVIAGWLVHVGLLVYWTLFAFYLKEQGALYYGAGESYWVVTFRSLIGNLFGEYQGLYGLFISLSGLLFLYMLFRIYQKKKIEYDSTFISFSLFFLLVLTFYLLKRLVGVNYPEDRTGLFFYVFFICALSFCMDERLFPRWLLTIPLSVVFIACGAKHLDLSNHPWAIYETMPPRFFDVLRSEQVKSTEPITIAGHRIREFIYGFTNYRSPVKLNHMTSPEALQMNCDYALAVRADKPWYDNYYTVLDSEERWGFRLLKRKEKIRRTPLLRCQSPVLIDDTEEFHNCFEIKDTILGEGLPLQADVNFEVMEAPVPLQCWFVVQVDGENEAENIFVRVPLDLMYYDWTKAGNFTISLVTPNTPKVVKRLVLYLWNINKAPIKIRINSYQLRRLEGDGITEISQAKL